MNPCRRGRAQRAVMQSVGYLIFLPHGRDRNCSVSHFGSSGDTASLVVDPGARRPLSSPDPGAAQRAAAARRSAERRQEQEVRRKAREQAAVEREQARRARAVLGELTLGRLARAAGFDQPNPRIL